MNTIELSPAVKHLVTVSTTQLADELPYYGKDALEILKEADAEILGEDMPDSLPRHILLAQRIAQLKRGEL